jgi:hypothetical protein
MSRDVAVTSPQLALYIAFRIVIATARNAKAKATRHAAQAE